MSDSPSIVQRSGEWRESVSQRLCEYKSSDKSIADLLAPRRREGFANWTERRREYGKDDIDDLMVTARDFDSCSESTSSTESYCNLQTISSDSFCEVIVPNTVATQTHELSDNELIPYSVSTQTECLHCKPLQPLIVEHQLNNCGYEADITNRNQTRSNQSVVSVGKRSSKPTNSNKRTGSSNSVGRRRRRSTSEGSLINISHRDTHTAMGDQKAETENALTESTEIRENRKSSSASFLQEHNPTERRIDEMRNDDLISSEIVSKESIGDGESITCKNSKESTKSITPQSTTGTKKDNTTSSVKQSDEQDSCSVSVSESNRELSEDINNPEDDCESLNEVSQFDYPSHYESRMHVATVRSSLHIIRRSLLKSFYSGLPNETRINSTTCSNTAVVLSAVLCWCSLVELGRFVNCRRHTISLPHSIINTDSDSTSGKRRFTIT